MYTCMYTSAQHWVFNSAASSPVCQSSGSGDDLTTPEGSGGLRGEGGAWHGVGRPPSSLSHGSLRKQVAAPEQRLRKRVRGSAFLTPRLPHVHPISCYPFFFFSFFPSLYPFLLTPCQHFPVSICLFLSILPFLSLFIIIPLPHRCSDWLVGGEDLRISSVCCLFDFSFTLIMTWILCACICKGLH